MAKKGWNPPAVWREAHRQSQLGRKHTEKTKAKMREAASKRNPPTAETRAKMSAAKKGKPAPEYVKRNLLKGAKRPRTDETRRRMSEGRKKLFTDPEFRQIHAEAMRRKWAAMPPEQRQAISKKGTCLPGSNPTEGADTN